MFINYLSISLIIHINILYRLIYIYTLKCDQLICIGGSLAIILRLTILCANNESVRHRLFKSRFLCILYCTYFHVHIRVLVQSILRLATAMCQAYDPAAWQIFESALKKRYAYIQ